MDKMQLSFRVTRHQRLVVNSGIRSRQQRQPNGDEADSDAFVRPD